MSEPKQAFPRRRRNDLDQALAMAALDAADAMVVITDTDGVIRHVNRAFTEITGYGYDEAVGANPRVLSSGQHDRSFYTRLWETVLSGGTWEGEVINRRKDGGLYTDRMTISPVHDAAGQVSHFIAVKRDVSARVNDLLAASPYGVLHLGADGGLVYANQRACTLLGSEFEDLLGAGWRPTFTQQDRRWLTRVVTELSGDQHATATDDELVRVVRVGDRHLRAHVGELRPGEDTVLGCVVALEDVTTEVEATAALRDRELFARTVIDTIDSPTAVVDGTGLIVHTNPAWQDGPPDDPLFGAVVGSELLAFRPTPGEDDDAAAHSTARVVAALREALTSPRDKARVVEHRSPGSRARWWQVRISNLPVKAGGAVLSASDVTAMRQAQQRSAVDAVTDPLTGLHNRRGLDDTLERYRHRVPFSLLFLDLDRFKPINDSYGHAAGDELLRTVAERLTAQIRDDDVAIRFGGDEFAIALPDTSATDANVVAQRLERALEVPVHLDSEVAVTIGASIGVVTAVKPPAIESLLTAADEAMYARKRERRAQRVERAQLAELAEPAGLTEPAEPAGVAEPAEPAERAAS